jgi:hypothetical protein
VEGKKNRGRRAREREGERESQGVRGASQHTKPSSAQALPRPRPKVLPPCRAHQPTSPPTAKAAAAVGNACQGTWPLAISQSETPNMNASVASEYCFSRSDSGASHRTGPHLDAENPPKSV